MVFLYLCFALKATGYGLEVDCCALCGSKQDLVSFVPSEGGYLCREDAQASMAEATPVMLLKMYRFAFRCGPSDYGRVDFPMEHLRPALSTMAAFTEDCTGVKLAGISQFLRY